MPLKILAVLADVTTPTPLYVVPAGKQVSAVLNIVNRSGATLKTKADMIPNGDAIGTDTKILWNEPIPVESSMQLGLSLGAGDEINVEGSAAGLSYVLHGDISDVPA